MTFKYKAQGQSVSYGAMKHKPDMVQIVKLSVKAPVPLVVGTLTLIRNGTSASLHMYS